MSDLRPFEWALAAAMILATLEVATGTFVFLGFCVGSLAAAAAEFLGDDFNLGRDALLFVVVAALATVALRRVFARRGDISRMKGDVNDY